jgi:hypothetical protein
LASITSKFKIIISDSFLSQNFQNKAKPQKSQKWRLHNRAPPEAAGWRASHIPKKGFAGFVSFVT